MTIRVLLRCVMTPAILALLVLNAWAQIDGKAGQVHSIPGRFQNFKIKAQGPAGIEKLKIFATTANVPLLPEQYNVSAFRSLDPKERAVTRDLTVTLTNLDDTAWAEGSFEFEVKPDEGKQEDRP